MGSRLIFDARASERVATARRWLLARAADEPVTVIATSAFAAAELIVDVAAEKGAVFGWQHNTLMRHAVAVATPRLAALGQAPAGSLVVEALCAACAQRLHSEGALRTFEPIAEQPGLPRALARTLTELRAQGIDARALQQTRPELAGMLSALEDALANARMADRATVLALASEHVAHTGHNHALLLLDVPIENRRQADFVTSLARHSRAVLATAPAGDHIGIARLEAALETRAIAVGGSAATSSATSSAEERNVDKDAAHTSPPRGSLLRLQQHLFSAVPSARPLDDDVEIMSAPGESRECVEIARRILAEATRGVPFDRMAVLLRAPDRYRPHLEEAMRRARIPIYLARGTLQPDPTGRSLLALLACATDGLSARRFAEYLSLGELPRGPNDEPPEALPDTERWVVPDEDFLAATVASPPTEDVPEPVGRNLITPRRWERLLVEAAVIGGRDRWERRLDGLRGELRAELNALEDADSPHADRILRQIQDIATLRKFALPLLEDLAALPEHATWGVWIDRLGALATRALARPTRVLSVLAELNPMADLGPIRLRQVRIVLERRLSLLSVPSPAGRRGRVLIAPCDAVRGMHFDVVFVPGVAERLFPQKVIEDPILRDHDRRRISDWLPTAEVRVEAERLQLRIAVGAACKRIVISYPRLDVDQARPRVPSFYGLEVLHAATGELPGFDELARIADRGGAARIGWPAPARAIDAIDAAEHDLALLNELLRLPEHESTGLAHYLLDANPHLGRALRFRARRWIRRWTPADGLVEPKGLAATVLAREGLDHRSYSCTALQHFARCPYKFYLYAVMRLSPRQEARAIEELDPLQRGSLVHDVQFEVLEALRDQGALPVTPNQLDAAQGTLDDVLERVAARYHDELAPAIERVWLDAVGTVRADLREWLRLVAEEPAWIPWRFELAFGLRSRRGRDPASQAQAVRLDCGIQLRGAIDLVELEHNGSVRATDHKTGKVRAEPGAVIGGGETLQPVLYALALEKLLGGRRIQEGRLFYCTEVGRFQERIFPLDDSARAAAQSLATTIADSITHGFFPAAPAPKACRWCDYQTICGPYEELRTRKIKPQRELTALRRLRKMR